MSHSRLFRSVQKGILKSNIRKHKSSEYKLIDNRMMDEMVFLFNHLGINAKHGALYKKGVHKQNSFTPLVKNCFILFIFSFILILETMKVYLNNRHTSKITSKLWSNTGSKSIYKYKQMTK
jgi:hypothetical protein